MDALSDWLDDERLDGERLPSKRLRSEMVVQHPFNQRPRYEFMLRNRVLLLHEHTSSIGNDRKLGQRKQCRASGQP